MRFSIKFACAFLALAASCLDVFAQARTVKLNSGLEAQLNSVGRDKSGRNVTANATISNTGSNTVFLVLLEVDTSAVDNVGGTYKVQHVAGISSCSYGRADSCMGVPSPMSYTVPMEKYTQIDPGTSISMNLTLQGNESRGALITLSASLAFRAVDNPLKDDVLSDEQKRRQLHTMNIGFPAAAVTTAN